MGPPAGDPFPMLVTDDQTWEPRVGG